AAAANTRGEVVLRAAGAETERWIPYAALADLLSQVPERQLAKLPRVQRAAVDGLLVPGSRPGESGQERVAYRLAWQTLLARCAETAPVLVLVDDAQWLDAASAEVITRAARALAGRGVRLLAAGRWPERVESGRGERFTAWLAAA